jgi:transcriptional antiterminator RfaH
MTDELIWRLLYTKPHAETWAELNLRRQGFTTLLPRIRQHSCFTPLFPRYVFAGYLADYPFRSLHSTFGVLYVVHCGDRPARVPADVIEEIRSRMDAYGVVRLDEEPRPDPLFARAQRERLRALERLAQAGFRVRISRDLYCAAPSGS